MHFIILVQNVGHFVSEGEGRRDESDVIRVGPLLSGEENLPQKPLQPSPLRSPGCMAVPHSWEG